jgi:hypothetical protein
MFFPALSDPPIVEMVVEASFDSDLLELEILCKSLHGEYSLSTDSDDRIRLSGAQVELEAWAGSIVYRCKVVPYPDWVSVIEPSLSRVFKAYAIAAKSDSIEQLTVTYVNRVVMEGGASELGQYFRIVTPPAVPAKLTALNQGKALELPSLHRLNSAMDFVDDAIPAQFSCILSANTGSNDCRLINTGRWDAAYDGQPLGVSGAMVRLAQLKDSLYLLFNAITTDKLRDVYDALPLDR